MAICIYWQQVKGKRLSTGVPSATIAILLKATNSSSFPITLGHEDIDKLRGIQVVDDKNEAWGELIDAIMECGKITLRVES